MSMWRMHTGGTTRCTRYATPIPRQSV